ncbi:hypothetical protein C0Z20_08190 [Trinickia symbiotica]|uniref:Class I SAM-dependent methyltransferase n=1 Tax=Trinickia symbiotica TaxID=863227 RepID=A0A2N7X6W4_9BURK|nr:hypothetical protein C0Z20_08190 [Trinickia symbiotica]
MTRLSDHIDDEFKFDLILDYSFLHHLPPASIVDYASQFRAKLSPLGRLLLVCYSENDPFARGQKSARGTLGNEMFYRTRRCIEEAYSTLKVVSYRETTLGKQRHHLGHCFVFRR